MKKRITQKLLATLAVAMFFMAGAMAQVVIPGWEDGTAGGPGNYVSTATEATTAVTVGKTIPLYAEPDGYYHPSYNPIDGTGLTAGFTWTWTPSGAQITLAGGVGNYIEVTGVTVGGPYTVSVYESSALCDDGTPEEIDISVLATPSFSITAPANPTYAYCAGDPLLPAAVTATIAANGASNYRLIWDLEIYTMSGAPMAADEWFDSDKTTSLGAAQDWAILWEDDNPDAVAASGDYDITTVAGGFTTIGSKSTVYVYTLRGINDVVSRRGDFLTIDDGTQGVLNPVNTAADDDFMYYDVAGVNPLATTDVLTVIVHPTPVTGPIFHISNTWQQ